MSLLKQRREERAKLHADVTELLKKPGTTENRSKIDNLLAEIETATGDIARIERADKLTAQISGTAAVAAGTELNADAAKQYRNAYRDYLRFGQPGNKWQGRTQPSAYAERFNVLAETRTAMENVETHDQAAGAQINTYTEGTVGRTFVPPGLGSAIEKGTK